MAVKNHNLLGPFFQEIIADKHAKHYRRLKNTLWLYMYLIVFANHKNGKLTASIECISKSMGMQRETISSWLGVLQKWQLISIDKQSNELQFKISRWDKVVAKLEDNTISEDTKFKKGRRSGKKTLPKEPEKLAKFIAEELDVLSSLPYLEKLCQDYPRNIIKKAFESYKDVPENKITSKVGLLTFFVKKYDKEKR